MTTALRVFVGRERELALLGAALDESRAGRGSLVLLAGEAGIGKTRVADELARRALSAGFSVRWGRCWEVGGAPAYWPWIQVLRGVLRDATLGAAAAPDAAGPEASLGAATSNGLMARTFEQLGRLLPELGHADRPRVRADAAQERFLLFDAVGTVLREAAKASPLLVILDDLHAADPSSLALLLFVARELFDSRLCIVGTVRDQEVRSSADRGELFERVAREATFVPLGRLDRQAVRALLASTAASTPSDELVSAVLDVTEGHPLFIEEVRRTLQVRAGLALKGRLPVPASVRGAIAGRVGLLSESTRQVLQAAAVLGRDFAPSLLAQLLDRPLDALSEPLRAALAAGMLIENEASVLEFSHALVREELYQSLPAQRRAELHARAADVLERSGAPEASLGEVASHLLASSSAVGAERALSGALDAARRALSRFAFEDASVILERALEALGAELEGTRLLCCGFVLLGEARVRMHQDGRAACTRAADIARQLGDPELLAEAGLALGAEISIGIVSETLVGLLEEALERLPREPSVLRARVLARLAGALQPASDPRQPIALAREAIAMARSLGDSESLRLVLHSAGAAMVDYARPKERLDVDSETLRLAEHAGDRPQAFRARLRLFMDYVELGDTLQADATLRALSELAEELRRPRHHWYVAMLQAMRALQSGRFADADRWEARALAAGAHRDDPVLTTSLDLYHFGKAILRYEDHLGVVPPWPLVLSSVPLVNIYPALWQGFVLARAGRAEAALACIEHLSVESPLITEEPASMHFFSEIALAAGDRVLAEKALESLRDRRGEIACWGLFGLFAFGPFFGIIARLEAMLGLWPEAVADFEAAFAQAAAMGARPALAELHYEYAKALAAHGTPDSTAAAARHASRALELARELDVPRLGERVLALGVLGGDEAGSGREAAPAPSPRIEAATPSRASAASEPSSRAGAALEFTLTREGDVWLIARGAHSFRLKDSRGLQMLSALVREPGREMHVLALGGGGDPGTLGDAGQVLDARAAHAYRERLEDLREAEREAEELGDTARLTAVREEIEQLAQQLSEGIGLGGRERRAASVAERARTNVQRRIRDAIARIEKCDPELGRYLGWTVRTGTFCVFDPDGARAKG